MSQDFCVAVETRLACLLISAAGMTILASADLKILFIALRVLSEHYSCEGKLEATIVSPDNVVSNKWSPLFSTAAIPDRTSWHTLAPNLQLLQTLWECPSLVGSSQMELSIQ